MKYLVTFLAGLFVGGVAALLYAPTSGEELRTQLRTQAEAEVERVQAEGQRRLQEFSAKLDEVLAELRALVDRVGAETEEVTSE